MLNLLRKWPTKKTSQLSPVRPPFGRAATVCLTSVLSKRSDILFNFFPDVRDVRDTRRSSMRFYFRLLRMNVQGCHNILAICFHVDLKIMTASGPVHHPIFLSFSLYLRLRFASIYQNQVPFEINFSKIQNHFVSNKFLNFIRLSFFIH